MRRGPRLYEILFYEIVILGDIDKTVANKLLHMSGKANRCYYIMPRESFYFNISEVSLR